MIEALELYTGEFLADFGEEEWVQAERAQLKKVYSDALKEVSEYLLKNEEFDELQKLTSVASELYPFDEWQAVQMQAMIGLERYKEAMKLYEQTSKHYFEELGVTPSGKPHGQQTPRDRRGTGRSSGEPGRKGRSILLFPRRIS